MVPNEVFEAVGGLLREPVHLRGGEIYRGRFEVRKPMWLTDPDDLHAIVGLSAREIVTAAENRLIWTDQVVQRGIKPGLDTEPPRELPLADGYPDSKLYEFDEEKADAITERLLTGDRDLRLSPLVWNLRAGQFEAAIDEDADAMYLYRGRIYLPDGHHRHQGIVKAYQLWSEAPDEHPDFDPDRHFTIDIYFMTRRQEAEFFYQKNWLPKAVARSKSLDLTAEDPWSVLAKAIIEKAPTLARNVNRVTDRLAASNPQLLTLSTLREVVRTAVAEGEDDDGPDEEETEELATRIAGFWEVLAEVRPELRRLDAKERKASRKESMAGQAVMMYGYAELMRRFLRDAEKLDEAEALAAWRKRLRRLAASNEYSYGDFDGDFLSRDNPQWRDLGLLQSTKSGGVAVSNTRQTRDQAAKALGERLDD